MIPVYSSHFGFTEAPFNITADPSFLYLSGSHREGLAQLLYGINARRGFIVLTGEVGTGKSTLIQALLGDLSESTQTALIFSTITSPLDLFRYVCEEFSLIEPLAPIKDAHDYIYLLNEFLLQRYRKGDNAALIIDEAQNLSAEVLESVRLLSNFETAKEKLLQILLVGQPELTDRLNTPQLRQLKQRVALRHHLRPLSQSETQEYIANRLRLAGGQVQIFPAKTVEEIYRYSTGIPRLVNVICDNAMISAYALDKHVIDPEMIFEVAHDLHLTADRQSIVKREPMPPRQENRLPLRSEAAKTPAVHLVKVPRSSAPVENGAVIITVPEKFFASFREALLDAMGPMAHIVLSEHIRLAGESEERFPRGKVEALVESVSKEIFDETIRRRFRQYLGEKMREF